LIAQHIIAMMQELPQRLALHRDARLGPFPRVARCEVDRPLDLFGRLGRAPAVVDPHVNRAIALATQARYEPRAQDPGLAEARLAEEQRKELALHAARQLSDFLVAAEEVLAGLLGEGGEPEPGIALIDGCDALCGRFAGCRVHRARACMKSTSRVANSGVT